MKKAGGYAHFPGTGPAGKTCMSCAYRTKRDKGKKEWCAKNREILGRWTNPIITSSAACKYYERSESFGRFP